MVSLLFALLAGCGTDDKVYLEQAESGTEDAAENLTGGSGEGLEQASVGNSAEDFGNADTEYGSEHIQENTGLCYVYVCGEVCEPGVYALQQGSRIYEAIDMAGGLTKEAGAASVNQAEFVQDGQMIYIPTEEEAAEGRQAPDEMGEEVSDGRVNLNTASASELMTLAGIGQAKADSILAYRQKNGGFSSVEEIMQVEGIKEGVYNRIKDDIKVK